MSKITYKGDLAIVVHKQKPQGKGELLIVPVHSFEVDGSATGKIDLASSDEQKIVCQLQQARAHKNVILYLKQGIDVPATKLINLPKLEQKEFTVSFAVKFMKGSSTSRRVSIGLTASFPETPTPVGKTPALLKIKLNLKSPELYYKTGDKKTEEFSQISC